MYDYPHQAYLIKAGRTYYEPDRPENDRYRTRIRNAPFRCQVRPGDFTHHKWPLYLGGPGNAERAEGEYDANTGQVLGGAYPNLVQISGTQHALWHHVLEDQPMGPRPGEGPQAATPDGTPFCVMDLV